MGGKYSGWTRKLNRLPARARPGWRRRLDQRTAVARTANAHAAALVDHLGGAQTVSVIEADFIERYVFAVQTLKQAEERALSGRTIDITEFVTLASMAYRFGTALGLRPRARLAEAFTAIAAIEAAQESPEAQQ